LKNKIIFILSYQNKSHGASSGLLSGRFKNFALEAFKTFVVAQMKISLFSLSVV
jgi:hypothetical protein